MFCSKGSPPDATAASTSRPTTCWCSAHPTSPHCTARCSTSPWLIRGSSATPISPRPGMSSRPGTNRLSRCASHRIGKGPVAQPDSRSRGPGHLVGAVFGGVFEPDDQRADRGGVPPAGQATRLQLRNCRQSRTRGIADFAFLAAHAPELFKSEWSGRRGRNIHHKFVVTDFNLPTAKVFTGSKQLLAVRRKPAMTTS